MSVLGKIGAIAAVTAAVGGGLIYWAYNSYRKEQEGIVEEQPQTKQEKKEIDIKAEVAKLKLQIDTVNPSLQDIKRVFIMLAEYIKGKTMTLSDKIKTERRRLFPKQVRFSRMDDYMRHSTASMMGLQNTLMALQGEQVQIIASLGLSQAKMAQFGPQLAPFMQELLLNAGVSLEEAQQHFRIKIEYLKANGERMTERLVELIPSLSPQERQLIPIFLNIFISDECFENIPNLDKEDFDVAMEKYNVQLQAEMMELQQILIPLSQKLQQAGLAAEQLDQGGYGYPADNGQYDMGGMGGSMQYNEERMMQQLEAIRQHDPQAYEQLMGMMQAQQMGR